MGDRWRYRIRVTGKDRNVFAAFCVARQWGNVDARLRTKIDWSGMEYDWDGMQGARQPWSCIWYNAHMTITDDMVELTGNCSGPVSAAFAQDAEPRVGRGLFEHLYLRAEIISYAKGIYDGEPYSARTVYERGLQIEHVESRSSAIANEYAPGLTTNRNMEL